jgi:hypothetical protein
MRITGLVPALRNPRKHELDELRRSVERFGFTTPCIIDERTGRLVAGHGRVQLLQIEMEAGSQRPEGVQQDADGEWMVPVLRGWRSRDDAEADAYLVSDNRQGELGGWDEPELAALLASLAEQDEDALVGTGYDSDDLADLLFSVEAGAEGMAGGMSVADREAMYAGSGIRSVTLPFPEAEFEQVAGWLDQLRKARNADTNSEVVKALLQEAVDDAAG